MAPSPPPPGSANTNFRQTSYGIEAMSTRSNHYDNVNSFALLLFSLACPENTYKSSVMSCIGCPAHTSTFGRTAQMPEDCGCIEGYEGPPGGPCEGENYENTQ